MTGLAALAAAGAVVALLVAGRDPVMPASRLAEVAPARGPAIVPAVCPPWFAAMAESADLRPARAWWWSTWAGLVAAGAAGLLLGGPLLGVVVAGATGAAAVVGLRAARHRRAQRIARSVPEALDAVARSCRAGASVLQAVRSLADVDVGPAGPVLAEVVERVDRGESLRDALDELVASHPVHAVRLGAAALLVGADTGAAPARAVEGVAATLRDHAALEREAAAHATQARASAAVLVLAPVGFGVFAVVADPRVAAFLFRSGPGVLCLAVGVLLDVVGAVWMGRMVRSVR